MDSLDFIFVHNRSQSIHMIVLSALITLLIAQLLLVNVYLQKRLSRSKGVLPLIVYTIIVDVIVLGFAITFSGSSLLSEITDSTVRVSLSGTIVVFFLFYNLVFLLAFIVGTFLKVRLNIKKRRARKFRRLDETKVHR